MILSRWSRWKALVAVFFAHVAFAIVIWPAFFAPILIEEPSVGEIPEIFAEYYRDLVALEWTRDLEFGLVCMGAIGAWAGLAVAFIAPVVGRPKASGEGRSLRSSVVAISVLGAFSCALLFATLVEGVIALLVQDLSGFMDIYDPAQAKIWTGALAVWIVSGAVWMYLLRHAGRSRSPVGLDRLLRISLAGTTVELALGLPLYFMARKKLDCVCSTATFLNLVMGTTGLLWLCGPWSLLLLTRSARRSWRNAACPHCGYPRGTDGVVCSECGATLPAA